MAMVMRAAATAVGGTSGAVVRLTVGVVVGGRVGRGFVRGFAELALLVVNAADFRRLLAHALVVNDVLSPLDVAPWYGLGPQAQGTRWEIQRRGARFGSDDGAV